jgi:hypothetical protein
MAMFLLSGSNKLLPASKDNFAHRLDSVSFWPSLIAALKHRWDSLNIFILSALEREAS